MIINSFHLSYIAHINNIFNQLFSWEYIYHQRRSLFELKCMIYHLDFLITKSVQWSSNWACIAVKFVIKVHQEKFRPLSRIIENFFKKQNIYGVFTSQFSFEWRWFFFFFSDLLLLQEYWFLKKKKYHCSFLKLKIWVH